MPEEKQYVNGNIPFDESKVYSMQISGFNSDGNNAPAITLHDSLFSLLEGIQRQFEGGAERMTVSVIKRTVNKYE